MGETPPPPIALAEEKLVIDKRQVETGRVRIRVHNESKAVEARASLTDKNVEVERVPVGREVTEIPTVRTEGNVTIYPVLEEILVVEKRLVLIEEVHVRYVESRTDVAQPITLRSQRADIERIATVRDPAIKE